MRLPSLTSCTAHLHSSLRTFEGLLQSRKSVTASYLSTCPYRSSRQAGVRRQITCSTRMAALAGPTFFLDDFAIRQWDDQNYSGTRISYSKDNFVKAIHEHHENVRHAMGGPFSEQQWEGPFLLYSGSRLSWTRGLHWCQGMHPSASTYSCPILWVPSSAPCPSRRATGGAYIAATAGGGQRSLRCSPGLLCGN